MDILGIASGVGAQERGSELGVWDLYYSLPELLNLNFSKIIYTDCKSRKLDAIENWKKISDKTNEFVLKQSVDNEQYLFLTGDHSNAFPVWNAMLNKYEGNLGLILLDAHLDAHTSESSETKNIHGMHMSHLLGYGDTIVSTLNKYPLDPKNLCFIGTRDYEKSELDFINSLGIKIFFMKDITKDNLDSIISEAINYVSKNTEQFGVSIDIDGFDPIDAPATGCFCPNGLPAEVVIKSLKKLSSHEKFCGLEISEFDKKTDINNKTKNLIIDIIKSVFNLPIQKDNQ